MVRAAQPCFVPTSRGRIFSSWPGQQRPPGQLSCALPSSNIFAARSNDPFTSPHSPIATELNQRARLGAPALTEPRRIVSSLIIMLVVVFNFSSGPLFLVSNDFACLPNVRANPGATRAKMVHQAERLATTVGLTDATGGAFFGGVYDTAAVTVLPYALALAQDSQQATRHIGIGSDWMAVDWSEITTHPRFKLYCAAAKALLSSTNLRRASDQLRCHRPRLTGDPSTATTL